MTLGLVPGLNCPQEMPTGSDQAPFSPGRPLTSVTIDLDNPSATLSLGVHLQGEQESLGPEETYSLSAFRKEALAAKEPSLLLAG